MDVFAQQRTHHRASVLAVSQLACLGTHTITGLLWTAGKGQEDWSADYRLFSRDRWDAQGVFDSVFGGVLEFLCPQAPLVAAMDDTALRKTGPKIPGVGYRRDPLSPAFHTNLVRGQRFIQVSAMLPTRPEGPASARAVPIRFQPAPPLPKASKRDSQEQRTEVRKLAKYYNLSTLGRDAIAATRDQLDRQPSGKGRLLVVGVDGSYTNQTVLRDLPPRTTLVGRVRKDAKLFHPPDVSQQPAKGRKRSYGQALPTPEEVRKDESIPWREVNAVAVGKLHTFRVKTVGPVLWPKAGPKLPLRLVVIAPVGYRLRAAQSCCTASQRTCSAPIPTCRWRSCCRITSGDGASKWTIATKSNWWAWEKPRSARPIPPGASRSLPWPATQNCCWPGHNATARTPRKPTSRCPSGDAIERTAA